MAASSLGAATLRGAAFHRAEGLGDGRGPLGREWLPGGGVPPQCRLLRPGDPEPRAGPPGA